MKSVLYDMIYEVMYDYMVLRQSKMSRAKGKEDYKVLVLGDKAFFFLKGMCVAINDKEETFRIGDGKTPLNELPELHIKKIGWIRGRLEEKDNE